MILPPVIRVFFGIALSTSAKEKIGSYICRLKKQVKPHVVRWSQPENLHITLQFLAEVKSADIMAMVEAVRAEIAGHLPPICLQIGRLQFFPTPYRPRVLVLEVRPQAELAELAQRIGSGIKRLSYELDKRPFRAHLTIGRLKYSHGIDLNPLLHENPLNIEPITISEIVLFRSEPQEQGSRYTILERMS